MGLNLIWAQSSSGVIGRDGGIPWRLPEDLERFKTLTGGHTVIMGRRTWESLPASVRPLPGRRNVVITRQNGYLAPGAVVTSSLTGALALAEDDEVWVIGGAEIYRLAMPLADRCEVTEVDVALHRRDEDALAPSLDATWSGHSGGWLDSSSGLRYRYLSYQR